MLKFVIFSLLSLNLTNVQYNNQVFVVVIVGILSKCDIVSQREWFNFHHLTWWSASSEVVANFPLIFLRRTNSLNLFLLPVRFTPNISRTSLQSRPLPSIQTNSKERKCMLALCADLRLLCFGHILFIYFGSIHSSLCRPLFLCQLSVSGG